MANIDELRDEGPQMIPIRNVSEVLVRDGRSFADFAFFLAQSREQERASTSSSGEKPDGGIELLRMLMW